MSKMRKKEEIGMYTLVINSGEEEGIQSPANSINSGYEANYDMMNLTDTQVFIYFINLLFYWFSRNLSLRFCGLVFLCIGVARIFIFYPFSQNSIKFYRCLISFILQIPLLCWEQSLAPNSKIQR